ncbi:helix-turn-helix domain-containing protein [Curvivirga sp.]|uniref:helix-turn-helix domain-containing protein n=1 Tax=Curvivirga sp. TaxID=2856848 RepID=UPI003B5A504B
MPHPTDVHVGQKVREARVTKGYSQEDLGKKLGISFQQVQKYEKGTNRIGSSRLWEISRALDSPITYFFDGINAEGAQASGNIPRRTIELAGKIDAIKDENIRNQILNLIKACTGKK